MYLFAIEISIFIAFIIFLYALKLNTKYNPKQIVWSFAISFGTVILQFLVEMIFSMAAYICYDNYTIVATSSIIIGIAPMIATFITILALSKIAGAKGKLGIILAFSVLLLLVSAVLSYIIIYIRWNYQINFDDLDELIYLDTLIESNEEKEARLLSGIVNVINFIPGAAYAVSVIICSLNNKTKKEEA